MVKRHDAGRSCQHLSGVERMRRNDAGIPRRVHARWRFDTVRAGRLLVRDFRPHLLERHTRPTVRSDEQRSSGCSPALCIHGSDAGTLACRRGTSGHHGAMFRSLERWPWDIGHVRWHAAGRLDRDRWCNGRDDGPAKSADDVEGGLRSKTCLRHRLRVRNAGPDHPAFYRACDTGGLAIRHLF